MLRKRRIRVLGFLMTVLFAALYLEAQLSKRNLHGYEKSVIGLKTLGGSNQVPREIPGVFLSNSERDDRVPGQLQRFARCFFPQETPVKKGSTDFIGGRTSERYSKSYLGRDPFESELFIDDEPIQAKEQTRPVDFDLNATSRRTGAEASTREARVKGTGASDLVLTPQQSACLKSSRDDRDLDRAKRIYHMIVSLQESRERLVKGLIQFNQTGDEAFQLRLNELNRAINAYQAKVFLGFTMKHRRVGGG